MCWPFFWRPAPLMPPPTPTPPRALRGVVTVRSGGNIVDVKDSGEHVLRMTRKEAQHLLARLAEALIDGA